MTVLSETFGHPGEPGRVEVKYLAGLSPWESGDIHR